MIRYTKAPGDDRTIYTEMVTFLRACILSDKESENIGGAVLEYADYLAKYYYKKRLLQVVQNGKGNFDQIKTMISSIDIPADTVKTESKSITSSHDEFMSKLLEARSSSSYYRGIMTMINGIDSLSGGLCKSHMIVIAARPSVGKTAFGLFITGKAIMQNKRVLFVSTEMDESSILARLYSQFCHIPTSNLTHHPKNLSDKDLEIINSTAEELENIHIETGFGMRVSSLYNKVSMMAKGVGIDMLVVDYLQNLKGDGDNLVEQLGNISNTLKKIAMDFEIPVIALAQLNRQAQHMDIPSMAEIKGSGTIEQDADLIMLLHSNQEEPEGKYWVLCDKNRHGQIGNIPMIFNKKFQTFTEDSPSGRILSKSKKTTKGF